MWVRFHDPGDPGTTRTLLSGGGLEPGHHLGWHASAVLHVDALRLGPLAHLSGIQSARRCPAAAPGGPPGAASCPPGGIDIARQCVPQCLGMIGVQVDLILRAVELEADGTLSRTAIKIIDEQGLYLLSHNSSITSR